MIDIKELPDIAVGGTTAITYTHDSTGRVIAAHCQQPAFRTRMRASRASLNQSLQRIKRLESLFSGATYA